MLSKILDPEIFLARCVVPEFHRLPLFGDKVEDDAIDFEWPSEDIWLEIERKDAGVGLKQIDLTFDKDGVMNHAITGISLTLTNGMKSPVFSGLESTGFN